MKKSTVSTLLSQPVGILLVVFLYGLGIKGSCQYINYTNFNVQNGLTSNEVFDLIQDHEKNIWIATARGIVKYNGEVFNQYTTEDGLGGNVIYYLVPDKQNRIWFLSSNGILSYHFQSRIFPYEYNGVLKNHIQNRVFIRSLIFNNDKIYFGTIGNGFFSIDSNGNLTDLPDTTISTRRTFCAKEIGSEYILGIRAYKKVSVDGIRISTKKGNVDIKLKTRGGMQNLFFVKRKNGELLISAYNWLFNIKESSTVTEYEYSHDIISLNEDRDSNVWVGTKVTGVRKFTGKKGFSENKADETYFDHLSISKTLQDSDGNYWFASLENGIFYIPEIHIKTIINNTNASSPLYITAINGLHDKLFIGTNNGEVYEYNGEQQINHKTDQYQSKVVGNVLGFYNFPQGVYLSGSKGSKFISGYGENKVNSTSVNSAIIDHTGNIFACLNRRVVKIVSSGDSIEIKNPLGCRFETIFQDPMDKTIWLGGSNGLFYIKNEQIIPSQIAILNRLHITCIREANGKFYLATLGNGIIVLTKNSIDCFNKANGLISQMVNNIIIENDSILWAATTKGLHKINTRSHQVETIIDDRKGLPSDEIKMLALIKDTLYVANNTFVSFFNTKLLKPNTDDPKITLEKIRLNEKNWQMGDGNYFSYDQNNIEFTIHSYLYRQLGNLEYKYRLKGLQDNYTYSTNNVIRFAFLPPGKYTFEAYALNEDRRQSSVPVTFTFTIRQAYWKTTWFYALIFLVTLLLVGTIIITYFKRQSRKRNLQLQLLESKQQAFTNQMNPHFIFNALNSVQTYILAENKTDALNYLGKFSKLMRQTLTNTREVLVPLSSEIELITHYLELEKSRYNGIDYQINSHQVSLTGPVLIPSMLIQPFIENSIKHGILKKFDKEGVIQIQFFMKEKLLYCVIDDDGVGLNDSKKENKEDPEHSSAGIAITLDRLRLYCKTYNTPYYFEIIDRSETDPMGLGTRVKFIIPYTLKHETHSNHPG